MSAQVKVDASINHAPPTGGLDEILDRLQVASYVKLAGSLDRELNVTELCSPLRQGIERMRAGLERPERKASLAALETARARWTQYRPDLKAVGDRYVRILCGDERVATDPEFVRAVGDGGMLSRKRRFLEAMIGSYLGAWRTMPAPDGLEALLRGSVNGFSGRSKRIELVRPNAQAILSPNADQFIGRQAVSGLMRVRDVLDKYSVATTGGLGRSAVAAALSIWTDELISGERRPSPREAVQRFTYAAAVLMADPQLTPAALGGAVDRLVLWDRTNEFEEFRGALQDALLSHSHLGDPRLLNNRANWEICRPESRAEVIRWLSRRDLAFFFDFVMDQTEDPHGRKAFWLRYIDGVADSTVALSPFDASRLRVQVRERISHAKVRDTDNVSAFMMRFGGAMDLIVVEFSRPGNALYIHDASKFERRVKGGIRASSFHLRDDLKGSTMEEWFPHLPGWESKVSWFLSRCGVRPS
jgi:hypothetical protein